MDIMNILPANLENLNKAYRMEQGQDNPSDGFFAKRYRSTMEQETKHYQYGCPSNICQEYIKRKVQIEEEAEAYLEEALKNYLSIREQHAEYMQSHSGGNDNIYKDYNIQVKAWVQELRHVSKQLMDNVSKHHQSNARQL